MLTPDALLSAVIPLRGEWRNAPAACGALSSDSRKIAAGELFVALRGDKFDGHAFVTEVIARGAAAAVVDRAWAETVVAADLPLLVVDDTRIAFGLIGSAWRRQFTLPVIGVVGSNGKTTVKEMIAAILAAEFGEAARLATTGNLNNEVGVPTMLLRLTAAHHAAVIEMGMNHPGETALLAGWVRPTVGLINNAQREHQEFMKTVAAVAEEHAALIHALPENGIVILNADDPHCVYWQQKLSGRQALTFGMNRDAVVRGDITEEGLSLVSPFGTAQLRLAVLGEHNLRNALGAAAAALGAGCSLASVVKGLEAFTPVKGRLQRFAARNGATVIDDTYNANPDSVRAAIDVLAARTGDRILVLGDMGEVGDEGDAYHAEVGAYAAEQGIQTLLTLGHMSVAASKAFGSNAKHFTELPLLLNALEACAGTSAQILVKGSRFMRMERVVESLVQSTQTSPGVSHAA